MGCGASVKQDDEGQTSAVTAADNTATTTWATKADPTALPKPKSASPQDGPVKGSSEGKMKIVDADDEEDEIEVICEGNGRSASYAANGQEAMELEMPVQEVAKPQQQSPEPASKPLSKQQQEEAAKLAEQRKRFDNQRYQRELAAAGGRESPTEVRTAGPPVVNGTSATPKADFVMGLNLDEPKRGMEVDMQLDCLPGGIQSDSPRDEAQEKPTIKTSNRNKHDAFDDDDEILMKEILESIDPLA